MNARLRVRWLSVGCVLWIASTLGLLSGQGPRALMDVRVAVAPTPFTGSDGLAHLAYELIVVAPPGAKSARLDSLAVFGDSSATPLLTYASTSSDLDQRVARPAAEQRARYGRSVPAGSTAVVYVWITLAKDQRIPRVLRHVLNVAADDGVPMAAGDASVDIRPAPPLAMGRPLRGGAWAHNGPGGFRSPHWGSVLADDRGVRIPQRYAIDFIGVDDKGRAVRGDSAKATNQDWVGFGQDVLAVADGVVLAARDGIVDNPSLAALPPPASPSVPDTYGNYVILEVNAQTFVHYAHLQRGSVAVSAGQSVRRGQVIGHLGNSGNTNGAHLHFNVADGPDPQTAQGLPFVFDAFDAIGSTTAERAVGEESSPETSQSRPARRNRALPLDDALVRFR